MRDHSHHVEATRETAVELLLEQTKPVTRTESIPIEEAIGRVLAKDAFAQLDMPNCLTCCMDSVALHWDDFKDGAPDTSNWERGREWQFANTGIGMPVGFDTAVVIENVELYDDNTKIKIIAPPSAQYAGTKPAGSSMHKDDLLVSAGEVITPLVASLIASGNNATVEVIAKPKIAFIPTGCELVHVGEEIPRGKNIETNSLIARGKIAQWGGEPVIWEIVPDDKELIKQAVADAAQTCDAVVLNAGSSKGSDDWNVEMLEAIGTVLYHETNHGPGHHSSGAVVDGTPVVGISGPPGGAAFTMDFYLYPVVQALLGQNPALKVISAKLKEAFPAKKAVPKKPSNGEQRPSIVQEGRIFYGIRQMRLEQDENGELWAVAASSSHLKPAEANVMDCYYALDSNNAPAQGEYIAVELRP